MRVRGKEKKREKHLMSWAEGIISKCDDLGFHDDRGTLDRPLSSLGSVHRRLPEEVRVPGLAENLELPGAGMRHVAMRRTYYL